MKIRLLYSGLVSALLLAAGCSGNLPHQDVLAECHGSVLYKQEVLTAMPAGLSAEDSVQFIHRFVEDWMREVAVAHEAYRQIEDLKQHLEPRVRSYEHQLARQAYGQWAVAAQLDTLVSEEEIAAYYDQHPDKFTSGEKLFSFFFVATEQPENLRVSTLIQSRDTDDIAELLSWSKGNATAYRLDSSFVGQADLMVAAEGFYGNAQGLPVGVLQAYKHEVNGKRQFRFLKLLDVVNPGEKLPLRACRADIRGILLSQRKARFLEEAEGRLLQQARESGDAKKYVE